mmetsp:Transcript_30735/g.57561  ORF Transcript_30735/g.57561 Transcript_30735/m.57561 type:complete len:323 (+) Transcript_30735:153-1121(+)
MGFCTGVAQVTCAAWGSQGNEQRGRASGLGEVVHVLGVLFWIFNLLLHAAKLELHGTGLASSHGLERPVGDREASITLPLSIRIISIPWGFAGGPAQSEACLCPWPVHLQPTQHRIRTELHPAAVCILLVVEWLLPGLSSPPVREDDHKLVQSKGERLLVVNLACLDQPGRLPLPLLRWWFGWDFWLALRHVGSRCPGSCDRRPVLAGHAGRPGRWHLEGREQSRGEGGGNSREGAKGRAGSGPHGRCGAESCPMGSGNFLYADLRVQTRFERVGYLLPHANRRDQPLRSGSFVLGLRVRWLPGQPHCGQPLRLPSQACQAR